MLKEWNRCPEEGRAGSPEARIKETMMAQTTLSSRKPCGYVAIIPRKRRPCVSVFGVVPEGVSKNWCCRGGTELRERKANKGGLQTVRKKAMTLNQKVEG